ncbi:MAG: hypothetical protein K9N62_00265 [Verrucomicrobia bacterium]|nr:hypothetical protein [Verrucomicrobiota bacterium]
MKQRILLTGIVLIVALVAVNRMRTARDAVSTPRGQGPESDSVPATTAVSTEDTAGQRSPAPAPPANPPRDSSPLAAIAFELASRTQIPMQVKRDYVQLHHESFDSYLATRDPDLLKEAAAKYPNEPQVQFAVLSNNLFPEERRKWIDALKTSDPDNSIGNYLSAAEFLKNGKKEEAFEELRQAMSKDRFDDYLQEGFQNRQEFLRHAGLSDLGSRSASVQDLELGHLPEMKRIATGVAGEYERLENGQRHAEADDLATLGLRLGQQMSLGDASRTLMGQLVGIAVEKKVLSVMDPARQHAGLPLPVEQMRAELERQHNELKGLVSGLHDTLVPLMVDPDPQRFLQYLERFNLFGEEEALRWARRQRGE